MTANGVAPPPLTTKSQRLAEFKRNLRRQARIGGEAGRLGTRRDRLAFGRDRNEWTVRLAGLAPQDETDARAGVARHIEHQLEAGARPDRELAVQRFERLARLAVDSDDEGLCALDRDGGQARGRGAAETKPHSRPRPGAELQRRGRPVREHEAAPAPAASADGGIGEIVLDLAVGVDLPIRQHDRRVQIDVGLHRFLDDDRPEQPASLLGGVGQARVRQVEIEAGVRRNEADVGAGAGLEALLGETANARARIRRAQAGKAQRRRLSEPVGELHS